MPVESRRFPSLMQRRTAEFFDRMGICRSERVRPSRIEARLLGMMTQRHQRALDRLPVIATLREGAAFDQGKNVPAAAIKGLGMQHMVMTKKVGKVQIYLGLGHGSLQALHCVATIVPGEPATNHP